MFDSLIALKEFSLEYGKNPRVHPNGFIQLDIDPDGGVPEGWQATHQQGHSGGMVRLHIWNPRGLIGPLPRQGTVNEVHDHVFEMRSQVMRGSLIQRLFGFTVGMDKEPTHELYRAVYNDKESRLAPLGIKGTLINYRSFVVSASEIYHQPAFSLHDTMVTPGTTTVTVMTKVEVKEGEASVVCPIDKPPDNSFDRATAADPNDLWAAIEASLS